MFYLQAEGQNLYGEQKYLSPSGRAKSLRNGPNLEYLFKLTLVWVIMRIMPHIIQTSIV